MRVRRHTAALIITSALFAAGVVAPADAKPGNGNANGHQKLHCRAFHASGVGVDDGTGTTTAVISRGNREIGTTLGTFDRDRRRRGRRGVVHRHHRPHHRQRAP